MTADDVLEYLDDGRTGPIQAAMALDREGLAKMCVIDYLITNTDRGPNNWGFLADAETERLLSLCPLFDHGNAEFDPCDMPRKSDVFPGKTLKEAALDMLGDSHIACVRPVKRSMFDDDAQYGAFMRKAVELGLYKRKQLSLVEKLMSKIGMVHDIYEPVEIMCRTGAGRPGINGSLKAGCTEKGRRPGKRPGT